MDRRAVTHRMRGHRARRGAGAPDAVFLRLDGELVLPRTADSSPRAPQLMFSCREGSRFCPILFDLKLLYCCF